LVTPSTSSPETPERGVPHSPFGIKELAGEAEVDVRLLPRLDFESEGGPGQRRGDAAEEAFHRGVAAGEAMLLHQERPDRLAFDAPLTQREDALAQGSTSDCSWAGCSGGARSSNTASVAGSGN
jgi:hypothetical protein